MVGVNLSSLAALGLVGWGWVKLCGPQTTGCSQLGVHRGPSAFTEALLWLWPIKLLLRAQWGPCPRPPWTPPHPPPPFWTSHTKSFCLEYRHTEAGSWAEKTGLGHIL